MVNAATRSRPEEGMISVFYFGPVRQFVLAHLRNERVL
jgi:hypothetical protein